MCYIYCNGSCKVAYVNVGFIVAVYKALYNKLCG